MSADGVRGRLFVWLQYALPQHALSRLTWVCSRVRIPWFKNLLTRGFLRLFSVDMGEAAEPDPYRYGSFNEFFTRALRPDARPIDGDPATIVRITSPLAQKIVPLAETADIDLIVTNRRNLSAQACQPFHLS